MPRKLTVKQESYKNNRIAGMGVSEAYKAAYDVKKMSDNSVSVAAHKLEQDERIAKEIQAKREEATGKAVGVAEENLKKALVTIDDIVKGLLLEAQTNGEGCTQSARVSAWKALTDYTGGFDANTQKVNHSGKVEYSDISDTELDAKLKLLMDDNG